MKLGNLVKGQPHQLIFCLQPIIRVMPGLAPPLKVDPVSLGPDLVSCWVIDFHCSICLLSEFVGTRSFLARCSAGIPGIYSSDQTRLSWLPGLLLPGCFGYLHAPANDFSVGEANDTGRIWQ